MAIIDLGRVAYLNKKEWQPTSTYEIKDVVSYHGSSWASLVNSNLKQTPSEGAFWTLMSKSTYQSWLDQGNIGTEADFITSISQIQSDWSQVNATSNSFIKNKPTTFTPSVHKHIKSEITDFPTEIAPSIHSHLKNDITDFPSSLPANGGNSDTVSGYTVLSNVPTNAKFTDTVYNDTAVRKLITDESLRATSAEVDLNTEIGKKVTAVTGKVLSTEDFTTLLKTKLEGLTNYDDATLSSALNTLKLRLDTLVGTSASSAIDTFNEITAFLAGITDTKNLTTLLSSLRTEIVAIIPTKTSQITNDSNFVVDTNYVHTDNNYSTGEKNKLSAVAANANNYTHPAYTQKVSGLYKITVDNKGHVSDAIPVSKGDITALGIPAQDTNTVYSKATIAADGLMSKEDKMKVDSVATNANNYSHPSYTPHANGLYKVTVDEKGHVSAATVVTKADIGSDIYIIDGGLMDITSASTSQEISTAIGGSNGFNAIRQAIFDCKSCIMAVSNKENDTAMLYPISVNTFIERDSTYLIAMTISFGLNIMSLAIRYNSISGTFSGELLDETGTSIFLLPSELFRLTTSSTSPEISTAIGGSDGFRKIVKAVEGGVPFLIKTTSLISNNGLISTSSSVMINSTRDTITIFAEIETIYYMLNIHITNDGGFGSQMFKSFLVSSSGGSVGLSADGDGNEALMNNGQYKEIFSTTNISTLASLSSLSNTKYSQKYTYTTATAQPINFASVPAEGFECMLDIKNSTSSNITQAIPNAAAWQCEETSLVIPAGKVGCISIRYVHGKYCVRVGL